MKTYKKIDLFFLGDYLTSTNQSKTCKEAKTKYLASLEDREHSFAGLTSVEDLVLLKPHELKAYFDKGSR
jgi:hypothetical protein